MRIFFSSLPDITTLDYVIGLGGRSFLFSYENPKKAKTMVEELNKKDLPITILVDSGAFSVWNRGHKVNIDEYAEFCKSIKSRHKVYFFNLDVIPHEKKKTPTEESIEKAFFQGLRNWEYLALKYNLYTIHTFHQFENISYLSSIVKNYNYHGLIGISPANDQSTNSRLEFIKECFSVIKTGTKVHLLGFTAKEALETFPAYSCDSSSWLNPSKYKEIFDYRRLVKINYTTASASDLIYYRPNSHANSFRYYLNLERHITKLWAHRGITWTD